MALNSSFLRRLSFSRGDRSLLPLHEPANSPIHLADLSRRPDDASLPASRPSASRRSSSSDRIPSHSGVSSVRTSAAGSASKLKSRTLFAGPPPPIAVSRLLYRDEEDATTGLSRVDDVASSSALARSAFGSVFHERVSPTHAREQAQSYEADTAWRNLRRRERTLQKELQDLLDVQSLGLAASLEPRGPQPRLHSAGSTAGTGTRNGTSDNAPSTPHPHVAFEPPGATSSGEVVPVRQPRQKPVGLGGARAGLARGMALLADLKAEEDANLASALSIRKKALAELRRLSARKNGITEELRGLESNAEEPLANELRELGEERTAVSTEITKLEDRLVGLRTRKKWLTGRIEDVRNRREAGLSGYRGALKDVDGRVSAILYRPPVAPLDLEAIGMGATSHSEDAAASVAMDRVDQSPGGVEFLRMRPERRTADMAKDWWESEIRILETRKSEVDKDRSALEDGGEVWGRTMKLVSDFERGLREEISKDPCPRSDGESNVRASSPDRAMQVQLEKMAQVMAGLEVHLQKAESEGWNLLICAIGAELEAFREAEDMLREALGAAFLDDDSTVTPPLARSGGGLGSNSMFYPPEPGTSKQLLKADDDMAVRDSTDVPPSLQASETREKGGPTTPEHEAISSDTEDEVPPEFLVEHRRDEDEIE